MKLTFHHMSLFKEIHLPVIARVGSTVFEAILNLQGA